MQRNTENYTPRIFFFLLRTDCNLNRVSRDNWPFAWFPIENLHVSTGTCSSRPRAVVLSFSPWHKGDGLLVGRAYQFPAQLPQFVPTSGTLIIGFQPRWKWRGIKSRGKTTWEVDQGFRFPATRALHESVKSWDVGKFRKLFSVAFEWSGSSFFFH